MSQCTYPSCTQLAVAYKQTGVLQYCGPHYADRWWNKQFPGQTHPSSDLRQAVAAEWTLTIATKVEQWDFEKESAGFTLEKTVRAGARKVAGDYVSRDPQYFQRPINGFGHSYFKLKSGDEENSFGVYAAGLRCPDPLATKPEGTTQLALDYKINKNQKDKVCQLITKWLIEFEIGATSGDRSRGYDLMGTNCTVFVKAACEAADIWWMASRLPAYSSSKGLNFTQTPNMLYAALSYSSYAYDPLMPGEHTAAPQGLLAVYYNWLTSWSKTPAAKH